MIIELKCIYYSIWMIIILVQFIIPNFNIKFDIMMMIMIIISSIIAFNFYLTILEQSLNFIHFSTYIIRSKDRIDRQNSYWYDHRRVSRRIYRSYKIHSFVLISTLHDNTFNFIHLHNVILIRVGNCGLIAIYYLRMRGFWKTWEKENHAITSKPWLLYNYYNKQARATRG